MGTDQLIELLSKVSVKLLPIALLVLLIFTIVFMKKFIDVLKATKTQIDKLDEPLRAIQDVSKTVEDVNSAASQAVKNSLTVVNGKLDDVKQKMADKKAKKAAGNKVVATSAEVSEE